MRRTILTVTHFSGKPASDYREALQYAEHAGALNVLQSQFMTDQGCEAQIGCILTPISAVQTASKQATAAESCGGAL